ncbi:MAG: GH92 family glycosyl hydrolase, partial [bacterium]|nr:GH92 family glycosyl hydrolase [Candidatus Colisoma equi]
PGYYAVRLDQGGVFAEVAAGIRSAIYRFTYDGSGKARLLVDGQWGLVNPGVLKHYVLDGAMSIEGDRSVVGWRRTRSWNERTTGWAVMFDKPFSAARKLPRTDPAEKADRYVFDFDLKSGENLMVKVALSARGNAAKARANMLAEMPGWDFDAVKNEARRKWNEVLGKAVVEGTEEQKKNWYTSLYHLYIQPNDLADVGEKPFYSTFSCWDTFRAAGPLYTILSPDKASEFVDSMLAQGRISGFLPIWTLWGVDNQCMIGTHSVPMIVDAYLKGTWTGDAEAAYAQIKETLTERHKGRGKENWDVYDRYGYYPYDKIKGESVSRTMECAYDDWCAAQMAKGLGKADDYAFFMKRAGYWKNVFDSSTGFARGKSADGKWREPFNPYAFGHGAGRDNDFTEGNAFQYTWHVMHDPEGMISAMGGKDAASAILQKLFKASETVEGSPPDVTGLIGQYVHGNEPSHHVIYFFSLLGRPDLAARYVREVFDRFYLPKPDGLCGNDDCGQMSAWYLFSAMGFYPFNPCGGEYVIGAPQVPKARVKVKGEGEQWKLFTVVARGLSKENKYVKSVTLNGKPITDWKIRHADIMKGGELVFEMGALTP